VFISGATGDYAVRINGFFEPTQEKGLDGRVLYAKRGDASQCIKHYEGKWHVKAVSDEEAYKYWACVLGGCGLEACTSRVWNVWDNNAASVKLVAGAEAQWQVRGGCLRARLHAPPPQLQPRSPPAISPFPLFCVTQFCFCAGR
jgi:hypothetical protein